MSPFNEYESYDATGLAELVEKGEVSADELLACAIERVEERNPSVRAVVHKMYEEAKASIAAGLPEGPFKGVPFMLKDLGTYYTGTPTTSACALFKDFVPDHDSELIKRYKNAGLVIFAKTATPEFGLTTSTESRLFGLTHNPWNLAKTAGGSSGGTAAAVASGMVPVSDGSDGGGSIRIPASCCGLVGLKPTRARIPSGPDRGDGWSGMSTSGVLSRSVRDTAGLLDVSAGGVVGDPYWAPPVAGPYAAEVGADPGKLRIAYHSQPYNGAPIHEDCVAAVEAAAKLCAGLGHEVEESVFSIDTEKMRRAAAVIVAANTRAIVDKRADELGRALADDDLEPLTFAVYKNGERYSASDYVGALAAIHQFGREMAAFLNSYDVLLTPTMAAPPVDVGGALSLSCPDGKAFNEALRPTIAFTQLYNATGNPAVSLPLYWNEEGLPIGVQFAAPFGDEATLLRLAAQLEKAQPWTAKRPVIQMG